MAWIFELAVECGEQRNVATTLRDHFDGFTFGMTNGTAGVCLVRPQGITVDEESNWWVSVLPVLKGDTIVQHSEPRGVLQEAARGLYNRLKAASGYRFALVGVEATQFSTFSNLTALVTHADLQGLVLHERIYASMRGPVGFECFSPDYMWRPYVQQPGWGKR